MATPIASDSIPEVGRNRRGNRGGAGATAGLIGVLLTRGPEAVLAKGTTIEIALDRPVNFNETELDFSNARARRSGSSDGGPLPRKLTQSYPRR